MSKVSVIRPQITEQEREKRIEEIEMTLSKILKKSIKFIDVK